MIDEAVAATCTEAGKTEGKHCGTCRAILVAQTDVPATGHKWGAGDICEVCNVLGENADLDAGAITVKTYEELRGRLTSPGTAEGSELSKITVRLGANIIAPKDGKIIQSNTLDVTLDLHGYTLTLYNSTYDETAKNYGGYGFFVQGAMTIKDTSLGRCGKIVAAGTDNNGEGGLITVEKASASGIIGKSNNQFALLSGTIDSSNNPNGCAILMWHSACVSINGGTVKAKGYAISGSTKDDSSWDKNRLIINGGNVESEESFAIYHPQHTAENSNGVFEINDGIVKGKLGAIYVGGNAANSVSPTAGNSGVIVKINGGTLVSEGECVICVNTTYLSSNDLRKVRVYVSGGRFEAKEGAFFVQGMMDKGVKSKTGKFVKGSSYLFVKLSGGVYNNLSSEKFVCTVDYISADKAGDPVSKKAEVTNNYEIVPGTDGTWTVSKKSN